jgi:hypothetical protein
MTSWILLGMLGMLGIAWKLLGMLDNNLCGIIGTWNTSTISGTALFQFFFEFDDFRPFYPLCPPLHAYVSVNFYLYLTLT